jgi:hypothetical protein
MATRTAGWRPERIRWWAVKVRGSFIDQALQAGN